MRGSSFRDLAGADVEIEDVERMLGLNETLFVEHKGGEPKFPLARAIASLANQLGGWVLVNVTDNEDDPRPLGPLPSWVTRAASPVDAVRDRLANEIDPVPPFEARTFAVADEKPDLLVIRVYESADTPHITSDGAVYVRGVAQDRRTDKYEARPIENQQVLRNLVERGAISRQRVQELIEPRETGLPLANGGIGLSFTRAASGLVPSAEGPLICARIAPHTLDGRFEGWARSHAALTLGRRALKQLTGQDEAAIHPHSQGFWLAGSMAPDRALKSELGTWLSGPGRLAVDAVGLVGASTTFVQPSVNDLCHPLTLIEGFAKHHLAPVIRAPASVLEDSSILGRATCHLWLLSICSLMRIEDGSGIVRNAGEVPYEGEITLPLEDGEINQLAAEAARAFAREGGLHTFEA
jgi:hypothetical protein